MVVGPQVPGHRAGMPALVEARVLESDRERPDPAVPARARERRRDARRVDPAREEDAQRDIASDDAAATGRRKSIPELLGRRLASRRRVASTRARAVASSTRS